MYEIRSRKRCINGVPFKTYERTLDTDESVVAIEAGSTGLLPDDKGGARTLISFENLSESGIFGKVTKNENGTLDEVEIGVVGNAETISVLRALMFATKAILDEFEEDEE